MSPHIVLIIMISSSALLVILLFALRRRSKKKAEPQAISAAIVEAAKTDLPKKVSDESASSSASSESGFGDLVLEDLNVAPITLETPSSKNPQEEDILQMVTRYRFFQGPNLERFEQFLRAKDILSLERLITEKFTAQGKANAETEAKTVVQKLLNSLSVQPARLTSSSESPM